MTEQVRGATRWVGALRQLRDRWIGTAPIRLARQGLRRREAQQRLLWLGGAAVAAAHWPAHAKDAINSDSLDPCLARGVFPTPPFVDEMPHLNRPERLARAVPRESLVPLPGEWPVAGEARRDKHQAWSRYPPQAFYELTQRQVSLKLHRDLPPAELWGFDGLVPGPTIHARCGTPNLVRIRNALPPYYAHWGYGMPETSTHLHNNHTPSESDGFPDDYYPKLAELDPAHIDQGRFKDYRYVNEEAGNDSTEALGTLWYHDHRHGFTAPNTYRGLAGFYLMFDDIDTGDENLDTPLNLHLPSGEYDVPLMLGDKIFDASGALVFDQFNMDGILGNKMLVNGVVQPYFKVARRKYRFRVLNPGPSRVYGLSLKAARNTVGDLRAAADFPAMDLIGFAGNLLRHPLRGFIGPGLLSPSQRVDVVVDFSKAAPGESLYLVNEYGQSDGSKPEGFLRNTVNGPQFKRLAHGVPLMRFDVQEGAVADPSRVPDMLRELPQLPTGLAQLSEADILKAVGRVNPFAGVATVRQWRFDRTNGQWAVNNQLYDGAPRARIQKGNGEIWILQNNSGGWMHPVHVHFEEFRVLYRANGQKPGLNSVQGGREDTLSLGPGERAVVFLRFRDFVGKYVMHCHNTVHEDHAMMVRWDIVE
jgi:FtsP/CotA-like multicopper oxidase with cupredoxin domain